MPAPRFRSRSKRRIARKTPGGKVVMHYVARQPSKAVCGVCGVDLKAVPRKNSCAMRNTPKTQKRPERPFGGVLCSSCMRRYLIFENRNKE